MRKQHVLRGSYVYHLNCISSVHLQGWGRCRCLVLALFERPTRIGRVQVLSGSSLLCCSGGSIHNNIKLKHWCIDQFCMPANTKQCIFTLTAAPSMTSSCTQLNIGYGLFQAQNSTEHSSFSLLLMVHHSKQQKIDFLLFPILFIFATAVKGTIMLLNVRRRQSCFQSAQNDEVNTCIQAGCQTDSPFKYSETSPSRHTWVHNLLETSGKRSRNDRVRPEKAGLNYIWQVTKIGLTDQYRITNNYKCKD